MIDRVRSKKSIIKFYCVVLLELFFSPVLVVKNIIHNKLSVLLNKNDRNAIKISSRPPVMKKNKINICIHEWGGYDWVRNKKIENRDFTCGLKFHLDRLKKYKRKTELNIVFTVSDYSQFKYKEELKEFKVIPVENLGMDLGGYSRFLETLSDDNEYLLLMNTSISSYEVDFIDKYLDFFEKNIDTGMVGISYNTRCYQTFIRNNFKPHLQTFFILSTTDILKKISLLNNNVFPGSNENYKLSIIRFGEIRLSELILKLNYKIAIITDEGKPYFFYRNNFWDNGFGRWTLQLGDCRKYFKHVNSINEIKNK